MHVKQVIIQGFKSYKDQTVIEPFSPGHNVIVGRNGSGKSNFFAAMRFVLSDSYTQLSRESRQALLHEGAGSAVMSAYVEIIFDNHDGRFPTDTDEVILRRSIGQKKDEYSLNRKNTTKQEIMNMLETAGFSKDNPYYIVPQGRVTSITNMKDAERLNMLKKVAGTDVYDNKRAESHKIMDDTEHKRGKIDELLDHIRGRLDELEEEKEELRAYQEKDRERKCLEYTIYQQELQVTEEALEGVDAQRAGGADQTQDDAEARTQAEAEAEEIENEMADLQQEIEQLTRERVQREEARKDKMRAKAQVETDVQSMLDNQASDQVTQAQRAKDINALQQEIKRCDAELAKLLPSHRSRREEARALQQQVDDADSTRKLLFDKQTRHSRFRSKKERDQALRQDIDELHQSLSTNKAQIMHTREEIADYESRIFEGETQIRDIRFRVEHRGDEQHNLAAEVQKASKERQDLHDERLALQKEGHNIDTTIGRARKELENAEDMLGRTMDQSTSAGLRSARQIIAQHDIQGAYGTIGELLDYNEKYKTAVEVTGGTSLFHYIVDTDATATRIHELMKERKGGRITCVPLNRIRPRTANIPKASDAVMLLQKLTYDAKYEKAFQQVFGTTVVCPNLSVASQYARSHGVTGITPDGQRADKKGAMTGGFHDMRKSRIDSLKRLARARQDYESLELRRAEIEQDLQVLNQRVTKAVSNEQKAVSKQEQLEGGYGLLHEDLRRKEHALNVNRDQLEARRLALERLEADNRSASKSLSSYEAELNSDYKKALSHTDEQQLEIATSQLPELRKQLVALSENFSELETRKQDLEMMLRENLRPRLDMLHAEDSAMYTTPRGSGSAASLKERQRDLQRMTAEVDAFNQELEEHETAIENARQKLLTAQSDRVSKQKQIEDLTRAIRDHRKHIERGALKRAVLIANIENVQANIRKLGVVPDAATSEQYRKMSSKVATTRLHKVQEALKKYGHVNKRAFDQFASFERSRELLEARRKELDTSDTSIRELIDVLDQRKDEAIERTFKQVKGEFAKIFKRLVPAGTGRLIIQRRSDRQQAEGSEEEDAAAERPGGGVENYTGVGISVSFNSEHDEQQRIQQLSGGQKSLCALALVFAIQASDPAPFYLFDEIDANLDAQYRTAVAEMLRTSSTTGQFICTTFRPEMLYVADKCYGVSFDKRASTIDVVSKEQALGFIEGQVGGK
nr:chromosome segregation protein suda [Quercus suber]